MNKFEAQERFIQRMKDSYPPGTRLVLLSMDDPYAPIAVRGTSLQCTLEKRLRRFVTFSGVLQGKCRSRRRVCGARRALVPSG